MHNIRHKKLLENWGLHMGYVVKCNIMRVSRTRDPQLLNYSLIRQVLEEIMNTKYLWG